MIYLLNYFPQCGYRLLHGSFAHLYAEIQRRKTRTLYFIYSYFYNQTDIKLQFPFLMLHLINRTHYKKV